jgi:hypothetical protein
MYKRNISWEPVLHKNYKGMYKRNIYWEPVLHKNYKGMYKRNISCTGSQEIFLLYILYSFYEVLVPRRYFSYTFFIVFMKYWFPG